MTIQLYALMWALFLAWYVLFRFISLFSWEIFEALKRFGKFLVYDVYARLFPQQFYKLVVVVLKDHHPVYELVDRLYGFAKLILGSAERYRELTQGAVDSLVHEQALAKAYHFNALSRLLEHFLDFDKSFGFWVEFVYSALGYNSYSLLMRVKPFREEIIEECLCAYSFLPPPCREFVKNYRGEHTANSDERGNNGC